MFVWKEIIFSFLVLGGNTNFNSSEIRQGLRNAICSRSQQGVSGGGGIRTPQSPLGMGQGPMVGNGTNTNNGGLSIGVGGGGGSGSGSGGDQQQQQQMSGIPGQLNTATDPSNMGFNFDLGQAGKQL